MSERSMSDIIGEFLNCRRFAVVGVSKNTARYGYKVFRDLLNGGYEVYPVNPRYKEVESLTCYPDLKSLPETPDVVDFVCPPPVTEKMVSQFPELGIRRAWMQPGAESPEALEFCRANGIDVLFDICVMVERKKATGGNLEE